MKGETENENPLNGSDQASTPKTRASNGSRTSPRRSGGKEAKVNSEDESESSDKLCKLRERINHPQDITYSNDSCGAPQKAGEVVGKEDEKENSSATNMD
jgi:hypothetical protein